MNTPNSNVPVVAGSSNAVAPQNNGITNGITLQGATANGANLALASASAAEVLGQMQVAKAYPRDEVMAISRILNSCQRPELAEMSSYTYSKGGTEVTGASVHLLKALAARWGNIKSGYTIVERNKLSTKCEAYATDLETNYTVRVPFVVEHIRHTKKGDYPLTDEREIYELTANMAARRERKCLEAIIPADVVQTALKECNKTLTTQCGEITAERINAMCEGYQKFGVSRAELEAFIQRPLEGVAPGQWVRLSTIFKSLRDGIAKKEDFFKGEPEGTATEAGGDAQNGKGGAEAAKPKAKAKVGKTVEDFLAEHPETVSETKPADGEMSVEDVM